MSYLKKRFTYKRREQRARSSSDNAKPHAILYVVRRYRVRGVWHNSRVACLHSRMDACVPEMAKAGGLQFSGRSANGVFDSASFARVSRRSFPSFEVVLFRWFLAFSWDLDT